MRIARNTLLVALATALAAAPLAAAKPTWETSIPRAFAEAQRTGSPILVDLYADWCAWCKTMERRVFPTPEFATFVESFVLLRVDVEDGGDGTELATRYDGFSLPTILYLEPTGALVGKVEGFYEAPDLVGALRSVRLTHEMAVKTYEQVLAGEDTDDLRLAAIGFYRRQDGPRAAALFRRLLEVEKLDGDDLAWSRFFLAESLRRAGRFDAAREQVAAARRASLGSTDLQLRERIELLPFWIARDEHECADARGAFSEFATDHPKSVFLPAARNALDRLTRSEDTCS